MAFSKGFSFGRSGSDDAKVLRAEREGDALIVVPTGDSLRVEESQLVREIDRLHEQADAADVKHVVVDLGSTSFVGTLVIGALMALCHKLRERGGRAVWCNASNHMREVIHIMRLDTVMPYFPTRAEALDALKKPEK